MTPEITWWELTVTVPAELADDLSGMLLYHGALGAELNIPSLRPLRDEKDSTLLASYDAELSREAVLNAATGALQEMGISLESAAPSLRQRNDTGWAEAWKSFFKPLSFGTRLWVVPRWESAEENEAMLADLPLSDDALVVHLEPGLAFGTGQHATTSLCLTLLEQDLQTPPPTLLDVGCGSGILSIAAARLGVAQIHAVDNDALAVRIAAENVEANGVAEVVSVSGEPLNDSTPRYAFVVANIIAPVLIDLAPSLIAAMEPGGTLLLSGILVPQLDSVKQACERAAAAQGAGPLRWEDPLVEGEWLALRAHL